jgi:hemoglobin
LRQGYAGLNEREDLTWNASSGRPRLQQEPTPFQRLGGADAVDALVERFYAEMDARPEARGIRALHGADLAPVKFVLKHYLTEWLGGPPLYSSARGHPRLRMRHMRFSIGEPERDAWLACMKAALEATVTDAPVREGVFRAFAALADHMRNRPPG